MKIRLGFVSNSSAASFCVPLAALTPEQLAMIKDYYHVVLSMTVPGCAPNDPHPDWGRRWWLGPDGQPTDKCVWLDTWWTVQTPADLQARLKLESMAGFAPNLVGYTDMDNFDFVGFLVRIGVPRAVIQTGRYDDDCEWEADEDV